MPPRGMVGTCATVGIGRRGCKMAAFLSEWERVLRCVDPCKAVCAIRK